MRLLRRIRTGGWLWPGVVIVATIVGALIIVTIVDQSSPNTTIRSATEVSGVSGVSGINIGGLDPNDAAEALEPLRQDLASTVVELQFQDQAITVTAEELGISLDTAGTLAEATDSRPLIVRSAAWLFNLFETHEVQPTVSTDRNRLEGAVTPYTDPESPRIALVEGAFEPLTTTEIARPDMELLAQRLEDAVLNAAGGRTTVVVPIAGMVPANPDTKELAISLATQANEMTAGGVQVQLDGTDELFDIDERALRNFIRLTGRHDDTHLALDGRIFNTLSSLFVGVGGEAHPATITLGTTGRVVILGGAAGFECCGDDAVDTLLQGLLEGQEVVVIPSRPVPHAKGREWAESLGISEVVGEFTTKFRAGQQRVVNIARIAELTQGAVIEPGQRFSVNEYVGPRTRAKGFVPAGMISDGLFVDSVGGGISQYATTLFNAAFFAGLDFIEYQSHTIYLSRYPYGREATVSHPKPDLVIENNTPFGMMLWPTTTATSITVKLYSTPWIVSEQTNQWTRTIGTSCTRVTTERTRTWIEGGRSETDTVWAQYRPEATRCDGSSTAPTTTTLPDPTCTAGCEETSGLR